jgi:hypothetical protein
MSETTDIQLHNIFNWYEKTWFENDLPCLYRDGRYSARCHGGGLYSVYDSYSEMVMLVKASAAQIAIDKVKLQPIENMFSYHDNAIKQLAKDVQDIKNGLHTQVNPGRDR